MRQSGKQLPDNVSLCTGLACFLSWLAVLSSLFSFQKQPAAIGGVFEYEAFSMVVNAAVLFSLFFAYLWKRLVPFGKGYFLTIGLCLFLGYGTGLLLDSSSVSDPAFSCIAAVQCILTNVGMACLSLEWIRLLGLIGVERSVVVLTTGSLMAAALLWACDATQLLASPPVPCIFPLGSLLAVALFYRHDWRRCVCRVQGYGYRSDLSIPYGLLATVFVSDFVGAAVLLLARAEGLQTDMAFSALTFSLSAVILLLSARLWRLDFNNLIYKLAYGLMALGCIFLAIPVASTAFAGLLTQQTGYRFMLLLTYLLSAWLIDNKQLSANWVYPVVTGVAFVGMFLGQEAATLSLALWGSQTASTTLWTAFAPLLLFAALMLIDTGNPRNAWKFTRPASPPVPTGERIDAACMSLAKDLALTKREAEVFTLIAKGYSRKFISEQLVLSPETIKAYANKMYAKIGVHSRQELIEMVNARMDETPLTRRKAEDDQTASNR